MKSVIDLWMTRLGYFYLTFPFILFTSLWLNLYAAVLCSIISWQVLFLQFGS